MKLRHLSFLLIGLIMVGLYLGFTNNTPETRAAFGTSPPWVRNDHLLPGTTYEQIVNISRNNATVAMRVVAEITGDKELRKWVKIENSKKLVMEKGQQIFPMNVIVKIPKRAALRDYKGNIFVTLDAIEDEAGVGGGSVAIKLGAHIQIRLSVIGDKITDYRIVNASLNDIQDGEPFVLNMEIENLGNTDVTELTGQVDIYNYKETEILKSLTFGNLTEAVSPDDKMLSQIIFEYIILHPGEYWIKVKIFKNDDVIYENRLFQRVVPPVVPVVTPESAQLNTTKPVIPKIVDDEVLSPDEVSEADEERLRGVAPPVTIVQNGSTLLVILGIAGLSFGSIALLAIVILLVVLIRRQRQATIQQYLTHSHDSSHQNDN